MKRFMTLFTMQLNANFGFSALKYRFRKETDKIPQTLLLIVALAITLGGLAALYCLLMGAVYAAGVSVNHPEIVLLLAVLGLQMFLLITGIFYVIGVFYYSKDMSALVPLPVKPWQVLGSKFAVVMAYEYLMAVPVLLPPMLIYGLGQGAGVFYWLKAALLLIVSPAIPLLLSSLAAMLLMRLINMGRRKDLLAIIGGVLATAGILGFNLLAQRFAASADGLTQKLAEQAAGFITTAGAAFPPSAWAALALSQGGLASAGYLLLYVALSAALLALLLWLAERIYYRSAAAIGETGRADKPAAKALPLAEGRENGPVRALFMREIRLLVRTPAFAMNCLLASLLLPVLIPMSMLQGQESTAGIRALITNPTNSLLVTLGAVALMSLISVVNVTASTALSREGRTFWVSRMIPVTPQRQVYAKFLASFAVDAVALVLIAVMLAALFNMDPWRCALALALGLLGAIPATIVNMLPDIIRPKLSWTNPYEAVKQNLNVLLSMLACCFVLGVEVLITVVMVLLRLPEPLVYALLAVLMAGQALAGAKALAIASGRYYKIEV